MTRLNTICRTLGTFLTTLAGIMLLAMMLLTCANIVSRELWLPISGTYELMGLFGAVAAAFALGDTQLRRGHVAVDILMQSLRPAVRRALAAINSTLLAAFFLLVAWQLTQKAITLKQTGEVTETLRIIYYPFIVCVALGCAFLALVLLTDLAAVIAPPKQKAP